MTTIAFALVCGYALGVLATIGCATVSSVHKKRQSSFKHAAAYVQARRAEIDAQILEQDIADVLVLIEYDRYSGLPPQPAVPEGVLPPMPPFWYSSHTQDLESRLQ